MNLEDILRRFKGVRKSGEGWAARCPAHDDGNASLSIKQVEGRILVKCHVNCAFEDIVRAIGLKPRDFFDDRQPTVRRLKSSAKASDFFDWDGCVARFDEQQIKRIAEWRGLSPEFVIWLQKHSKIGLHKGNVAFPVETEDGEVKACHYRVESGDWYFFPTGVGCRSFVFGNVQQAQYVLCFESQWDAFGLMDKYLWHLQAPSDTAIFITRGAENGKLIQDYCCGEAILYAFVQNDEPDKKGKIASEDWASLIAANAKCKVLRVTTPKPHKDLNDWTRAGATKEEIEKAILAARPCTVEASSRDNPDKADRVSIRLLRSIVAILSNPEKDAAQRSREIAALVVDSLYKIGRFYFHADLRDFQSAMFFDSNRKRLERIQSDSFVAWLSDWLQINRADNIFKYITSAIETAALSPNATGIVPECYWASRPGAIYLSNGDGSAVKISATGITLVDNGTDDVLFAAGCTLQPWKLVTPQDPFEVCSIFRNFHSAESHGRSLVRLWLNSLPTNPNSKPPLCLAGPIGSGKTRFAQAVAELYGLPFIAQKVEEAKEADFWPCCDAGGLFILDNADTRCRWLADAVANAATAGCSRRRKLYADSETVVLRPHAWLCITTANPTFASDSGLADRLIVVRMAPSGEETKDAALTAEILAARNTGLSHIVDTLQKALVDTKPTPPGLNARHPDWGSFAVRVGRALGYENETVAALRIAETDKSAFCLENDVIAAPLLVFLRQARTFNGTAAELVPHLVAIDSDLDGKLSPKRLGKRLVSLWPHLQKALKIAKKETDRKGLTVFRLEYADCAEFNMTFS